MQAGRGRYLTSRLAGGRGATYHDPSRPPLRETPMKTWMCVNCGFVYDEAKGHPESGVPAGTAWADVPDDWVCPDCGASKDSFEMVEL